MGDAVLRLSQMLGLSQKIWIPPHPDPRAKDKEVEGHWRIVNSLADLSPEERKAFESQPKGPKRPNVLAGESDADTRKRVLAERGKEGRGLSSEDRVKKNYIDSKAAFTKAGFRADLDLKFRKSIGNRDEIAVMPQADGGFKTERRFGGGKLIGRDITVERDSFGSVEEVLRHIRSLRERRPSGAGKVTKEKKPGPSPFGAGLGSARA